MNNRFRRIFWFVAIVHVAFVLVLVTGSFVSSCRQKNKPQEIITFVDLQAVAPEPAPVVPVESITPPAPPPPEPKKIAPPKKKKKIEISKKRIKRQDEQPPPPKEKQPKMTEDEIKKMLGVQGQPKKSTAAPDDFPFAWYYALVRQAMYEVWEQPGGLSASAGLRTLVKIRVQKDGTITRRDLERASGNKLMDDSVMKAVRSVSKLQALPPKFGGSHKDITVEFELTGMSI